MASVKITDSNFSGMVLESSQPVLVDFWASWCGPCRAIGPIIEEIAQQYEGKVLVSKLNVDENSKTAENYSVTSIPTLLFFKDGKVVDKFIGIADKNMLSAKLDAVLGLA